MFYDVAQKIRLTYDALSIVEKRKHALNASRSLHIVQYSTMNQTT